MPLKNLGVAFSTLLPTIIVFWGRQEKTPFVGKSFLSEKLLLTLLFFRSGKTFNKIAYMYGFILNLMALRVRVG
jgi:hypothetical protein